MTEDKIIEKIKKALALAQDNPTDEESHTAMLAVQRLLARHNLSMQDVEGYATEKEKKVNEVNVGELTGRIPWWHKDLALTITENFKCKCFIIKPAKFKSTIRFLGLEEDVAIAIEVYKYALNIIDKLAKSYVGKIYRQGLPTTGVRNTYISGFLSGLKQKFKEQVEKNNWGLVLVTDALVVQAIEDKKLTKGSSSGIRPNFSGDSEAYNEGKKQGTNFADSNSRRGIE